MEAIQGFKVSAVEVGDAEDECQQGGHKGGEVIA
jgi:hypothetical protein